ncbi:hypothetical protein ACFQ6C_25855 [Streptomyces sp. NPDC056454]|uniref:hypothetical protein n=1 Tax=Streptomyces sp. NPDC056454 TaxID=3345823 RepID=UPI0036AB8DD4
MFLLPVPEGWDPEEHGWVPADPVVTEEKSDRFPLPVVYLRWAPPVRFPASLSVLRWPERLVALYNPLSTSGHGEAAPGGVLLDEVGLRSADSAPSPL